MREALYYQDVIQTAHVTAEHVFFPAGKELLAGCIYRPSDAARQQAAYPAIVVGHPAGGVKEQTAGVYAVMLAEQGFLTLTFDARYQGESSGAPRYLEDPETRVEDFRCAVDYLTTLADVDAERLGILGMCAAGGYVVRAAGTDVRMKAIATVSMADLGDMFRTGLGRTMTQEMRDGLLAQVAAQRTAEAHGAPVKYIGYVPGTQKEAEKLPSDYYEGYDYYRVSPARHPRSVNKMIFSEIGRLVAFTALDRVDLLGKRPYLAVAGTKAGTRYFAEESTKAAENGDLCWIEDSTHIELYYVKDYVERAVERLTAFFQSSL